MNSVALCKYYKVFVRDTLNSPFVNHKGKDVKSDWHPDQWDKQSALGYVQVHNRGTKGDYPEVDTAQTQKRLNGLLALLEKIRKTFTDSNQNMSNLRIYNLSW